MSLNISKLEHIRTNGAKTTARCPACAEAGHDQKGEHLIINPGGSFGCVVYPGDSAHRKRIFALCGDREIKPLSVHPADLGRLGRVNQSPSSGQSLKIGLLGRLGRVFETYLEGHRQSTEDRKPPVEPAEHQLNECKKGVPSVLSKPTLTPTPHRPLTERERGLLIRWCGTDNHPLIIEAINLFNATIVDIVPTKNYSRYVRPSAAASKPEPGRAQPATKPGDLLDENEATD